MNDTAVTQALQATAYRHIRVRPINRVIGAEIEGVDIAQALSQEVVAEIRAALVAHHVIFFRDQALEHDSHVRFSRQFGELYCHPALRSPEGFPEVQFIQNVAGQTPPHAEFHTDATFLKRPFMGCVLRAVAVPELGGDTMWASLGAAYDALSPRMQQMLEGLHVVHSPERAFGAKGTVGSRKTKLEAENNIKVLGDAVHPLVRTHPESERKMLFVNRSFATSIVELSVAESDALLSFLFDHLDRPEFAVRFSWRNGSVAFWDNRATVHRAVTNYGTEPRLLFRTTIEGEEPV